MKSFNTKFSTARMYPAMDEKTTLSASLALVNEKKTADLFNLSY